MSVSGPSWPSCYVNPNEIYLFVSSLGSCNRSTAFNCGDYTCIPLAYRCDGVPDCQTTEDESNCVEPTTCQEWWNAGYRENGMYKICRYLVLFSSLFIP